MIMNLFNFLFSSESVNSLSTEEFQEMIANEKDALLIDVRTQQENKQIRIPNSILIDYYSSNFSSEIEKLDRSKTCLIYCKHGQRSYQACREFKQIGFNKVFNLDGGIVAWKGNVIKG